MYIATSATTAVIISAPSAIGTVSLIAAATTQTMHMSQPNQPTLTTEKAVTVEMPQIIPQYDTTTHHQTHATQIAPQKMSQVTITLAMTHPQTSTQRDRCPQTPPHPRNVKSHHPQLTQPTQRTQRYKTLPPRTVMLTHR